MPLYIVPKDAPADTIRFDAYSDNGYTEATTMTSNPVDKRAAVTDHLIMEPREYHVRGFITNTPIEPTADGGEWMDLDVEFPVWSYPLEPTPGSLFRAALGLVGDAIGAIGDAIFGSTPPPKLHVLGFAVPVNRPLICEQKLSRIQAGGLVCMIVTATRTYDNMILTMTEGLETEGGEDFNLVFQELMTSDVETVTAPQPAELRGVPGVTAGDQAKKPLTVAQGVKAQSTLNKMLFGD